MGNKVSIQFLGAAGTVTGSKHLLKTPEKNILIDCGLFQGIKSLRLKNWQTLPVSVSDINMVILTHAHLDHCGYLPMLAKSGFKGEIIATPPTRDLVEIILRDSAKIQEEDAEHANRKGFSKHKPALPLYTVDDVERVMRQFKVYDDNEWVTISENIKFRYLKNGHILGSCFLEIKCFNHTIVFSGDIGTKNSLLLNPPTILQEADFLVMESTYGNRNHDESSPKEELANVIIDTLHAKGNLIIPSFAVGRAQEIMHLCNMLKKEIRIPPVPVYMDSPMGAAATHVLEKYPRWHKLTTEESNAVFNDINIITDYHDTQNVIHSRGNKIIIAASGMITGGRILEYLTHYIDDRKNTVLLVGFQAAGTRGRALKEGAHEIKIQGRYYPVRAKVAEISSLSAHADQHEMLDWMNSFTIKPKKIFLVHGEPDAREAFRVKIKDNMNIEVISPEQDDEQVLFEINN